MANLPSDEKPRNQTFYTFSFADPAAPRIVHGPRMYEDYTFRFFIFDTLEDAKKGICVYREKCSEGRKGPFNFRKMQIEKVEFPSLDRHSFLALMNAGDTDEIIVRSEIIEVVD